MVGWHEDFQDAPEVEERYPDVEDFNEGLHECNCMECDECSELSFGATMLDYLWLCLMMRVASDVMPLALLDELEPIAVRWNDTIALAQIKEDRAWHAAHS